MSNYAIKENDRIIQIIYNPDNDILNNIKKSLLKNQTIEETTKNTINNIPTQEEYYQQELLELEQWFILYDLQVKQYERATRLGETFDKDIKMLDNEAREKASRVKELRKLLEG